MKSTSNFLGYCLLLSVLSLALVSCSTDELEELAYERLIETKAKNYEVLTAGAGPIDTNQSDKDKPDEDEAEPDGPGGYKLVLETGDWKPIGPNAESGFSDEWDCINFTNRTWVFESSEDCWCFESWWKDTYEEDAICIDVMTPCDYGKFTPDASCSR